MLETIARARPALRRRRLTVDVSRTPLTAAGHALELLLSDAGLALEILRAGKDPGGLKSSLTGDAFSWERAFDLLDRIEILALQERVLMMGGDVRELLPASEESKAALLDRIERLEHGQEVYRK